MVLCLLKVSDNDDRNFQSCDVLFRSPSSFPWWYQKDNKRWYHHHQGNMWSTSCSANYQHKQICVCLANIQIFFILGCLFLLASHLINHKIKLNYFPRIFLAVVMVSETFQWHCRSDWLGRRMSAGGGRDVYIWNVSHCISDVPTPPFLGILQASHHHNIDPNYILNLWYIISSRNISPDLSSHSISDV